MKQSGTKLEIRERRVFSEGFKKAKVEELLKKQISICELSKIYDISRQSLYDWLYKYSPHHNRKTTFVVQMESEGQKTKYFMQRVAELERIVGQKQLEVDFLNKLLEIGSEELGFDLKKNFSAKVSNGIVPREANITTG